MKKVLVGLTVLGVLLSATAFASPLAKIQAGKGKVDAAVSISPAFIRLMERIWMARQDIVWELLMALAII